MAGCLWSSKVRSELKPNAFPPPYSCISSWTWVFLPPVVPSLVFLMYYRIIGGYNLRAVAAAATACIRVLQQTDFVPNIPSHSSEDRTSCVLFSLPFSCLHARLCVSFSFKLLRSLCSFHSFDDYDFTSVAIFPASCASPHCSWRVGAVRHTQADRSQCCTSAARSLALCGVLASAPSAARDLCRGRTFQSFAC